MLGFFSFSSSSYGKSFLCFVFIAVLLLITISTSRAHNVDHLNNATSSSAASTAIFVFGDSTVDPGNNNYIPTIAKSNFLPYGRDLAPSHIPTGRFCNGKLVTDFIASYLGIKELVPPYLDPTLSFKELMTGVSFASAANGYDPLTSQLTPKFLDSQPWYTVGHPIHQGVIPMLKELDNFKEYKAKLEAVIGQNKTEDHIQQALFVISAGTNDFIINYFGIIPVRRNEFTVSNYHKFLVEKTREFLQGLLNLGARRVMIIGVPAIGCIPDVITFKSQGININRDCVDKYSAVSKDYNTVLQQELVSIQQNFANNGGLIQYADIYNPLQDIIDNYDKYGFEERRRGCCATGMFEASFLCNPTSFVCPDASKYVFWDSFHPSEKTYHILFNNTFRNIVDLILAHQ